MSKKKKKKKKKSTIQTKYRSLEEILYFQSRFQSIHVRRFVYREMKSFIKLIPRKERFIDNGEKKRKKKKLKRFLVNTGATGVEIVKFRWSRDILEWIESGGCRRFEVSHKGHPVVARRKRYCRKMFLVVFDFSWFLFERNDGLSTCSHVVALIRWRKAWEREVKVNLFCNFAEMG